MRHTLQFVGAAALLIFGAQAAQARGFGAARGGYAFGGRGMGWGGFRAGGFAGPYGGHFGGGWGGTYIGPRGTGVQAGRFGGLATGPFGGVHARSGGGVRVTTPGGRTYTGGHRGGGTVGPHGGVYAGGYRGGIGTGPHGLVGGHWRGGAPIGPFHGLGTGRGVLGHSTHYVSPAVLRTRAAYVRAGNYRGYFSPGWYGLHTAAWRPVRWWRGLNIWYVPVWQVLAIFCVINAPPIWYDYGSTIVIQDNYVYVDGDKTVSAAQYAGQALNFADRGRDAKVSRDEEWQPLGVFGLVQGDEKVAQNIFQLAVNKAGIIRGNYYNAVADENKPVYGSVDRKSQRAAWSIGDRKNVVFEAGLNNLTQQQTTVLVHYGKERTQQMLLVRLEEPKDDKE